MKKFISVLLLITMLLSSFCFTAMASEEVVITTSDTLLKRVGSGWAESTNASVAGPNGGSSWYTRSKDDSAICDASDLSGSYGVYIYMTPWAVSSANMVDVTITASGKTETLTIEGLHGGIGNRHWLYLGKYSFNGSADNVTCKINANATGEVMRVSGFKFVKDDTNSAKPETIDPNANANANSTSSPANDKADSSSNEVIITSADSLCKRVGGGWTESTNPAVAGPTDKSSWYTRERSDSVVYDVSALSGSYGVYIHMTPYGTTAKMVDVVITASGKKSTITIDGLHGGIGNRHWLFLGKFDFNASSGDNITCQVNASSPAGEDLMRTSGFKFIKNDTNTAKVESLDVSGVQAPPAIKEEKEEPKEEPVPEKKEIVYTTVPETGSVMIGSDHCGYSMTGTWTASGLSMPVSDKAYYTYGINATATWYPYLNKAENVEILYYKPRNTNTEEPAAEIEVFANGKSTKQIVNFTVPPTGWYSLGKFNFSGDGSEYIKISKTTDSDKEPLRATCLRFAINDPELGEKQYVSAFFGTDLHIVERLGMLIGEGDGITEEYIKKIPTRVQAAIMVLRLNGVDSEAAAFTGTDNFADAYLEEWAKPYLAYLKAHPEFGLIGTGENKFEPTANIDEQAYAKILLTALGYEYNVDFTWDETLSFAAEKGIAKAESGAFNVKDLAIMTASALKLNCKDGTPLLEKLIAQRDGVADESVYGYELPADMKALRDESRSKKRFIYNNDGNDVYKTYPEYPASFDISHLDGTTINAENFLKARTYGLENTQVTTVTYNTGVFNSCHHESTGVTDVRVRDWARALKEFTGKDSLTTMVDYVHSVGREIFFSMRVNDTHDYTYKQDQLDPWKMAHPELLMFKKSEVTQYMPYGGTRWSSADYTHNEVRKLVYDVYADVLARYDVDGIELDFTRHPVFFKEVTMGYDIYPENIERMNNLIRSIRDLTEKVSVEKGKPILIDIVVPDSLDFCHDIGLDVRTWLEEGLVDIVSIGSSHPAAFQHWNTSIKEYDGYDVTVHANLDPNTFNKETMDEQTIAINEAAFAYACGADGISMYNQFNINSEVFDILGTKETCPPYDPSYVSQRVSKPNAQLIKGQDKYFNLP